MVALLPDSSSDLWRLCHNLARFWAIMQALLPYLVIARTEPVSFMKR
jgi:hypothetical protein